MGGALGKGRHCNDTKWGTLRAARQGRGLSMGGWAPGQLSKFHVGPETSLLKPARGTEQAGGSEAPRGAASREQEAGGSGLPH